MIRMIITAWQGADHWYCGAAPSHRSPLQQYSLQFQNHIQNLVQKSDWQPFVDKPAFDVILLCGSFLPIKLGTAVLPGATTGLSFRAVCTVFPTAVAYTEITLQATRYKIAYNKTSINASESHLFTWYHHKMSCRRESPQREFIPVVVPAREFHSGTKSRNGIM